MNVFETYAKIGLDTKDLMSGLAKARAKMSTFSNGVVKGAKVAATGLVTVTAGVTAVGAALGKNIDKTAEYGDNVDKMSQKIGLSAKAYQQWDYVMKRAGTSVDSLKMGMKTLSVQASKGSKEFEKLGISQKEVSSLSKEDLLKKTITQLSKMEDGAERSALATKLLGRAGVDLGPLLNEGSKEIEKQMKIAKDYGMIMSDESVKASATFKDSLTTLQGAFTGLKNRMMGEFLPSATQVTDGLAKMLSGDYKQGSKDFEKGIQGIIEKAKKVLPEVVKVGKKIISTIGSAISDNIDEIAIFGTKIVTGAISGIIRALPTLISALPTILNQLVSAVESNLPIIIESAKKLVMTIFESVSENGGEYLTKAISFISNLLNLIGTQAPTLIPKVVDFISNLIFGAINFITSKAPSIIASFLSKETGIINGLVNALPSLISKITTQIPILISNIASLIAQTLPKLIDNVISIFENLVNKLPTMIENFLNNLPTMLDGIGAAIEKLLPAVMDGAVKLINALIKSAPKLTMLLLKLPPMIITALIKALIKLAPRFISIGKVFIQKTIDGAKSMFESLKKYIVTMWNNILDFFHVKDMIEVGKNILRGLINGLLSAKKWMEDKLTGIASGIIKKFKSLFGIHSPSRVFAELGKFLALGLGIGWDKTFANVDKKINDGLSFTSNLNGKVENASGINTIKDSIIQLNDENYTRLLEALESTTIVLDNKEVGRAVRRYA